MSNFLKSWVSRVITARRLRRGSLLPLDMQGQIVSSLRGLDRLSDRQQTVQLMGFQVAYRGAGQLRWLFREVFVNADYYFKSDNARPTIVDCGSNIGISILFFKRLYPQSKIIAFEPDPQTFETLQANIRDNGLSDVDCHQIALGDFDGNIDLYQAEDESRSDLRMSTFHERMPTKRKVTVPVRKLSNFIENDVDLLKVDVEGAEVKVLSDLHETGKLRRIKSMHIEYHHHIDRKRDDLSVALRMLESAGFGYQFKTHQGLWPIEAEFQDISIYCYRKNENSGD
jgi:FkbM family methyltransferase